ncbi:hypothetical protein [Ktedonobacter sp. SOSP1-52]|uniref:hypothetical protein n=1 Tax=Ktedonobacter sp. SOSP1-52 TaxID=2778366 RepID=UPI001F2A7324|nr:hypothetical protein [Ktedonobacter sp. SOSP1-52]
MRTSVRRNHMLNIGGVIPGLAVKGDALPARSECGIGGLMAWADRLWFITYVSHTRTTGAGTGLYEVDEDLQIRKRPESVVGTYANRLLHTETNQVILGPHLIDVEGNVRTIEALQDHRLAATMRHLHDPANKVYFLTMEGLFLEFDLNTFNIEQLYDLTQELQVPRGAQPHFKSGHTSHGRVVVTNNTYDERDFAGTQAAGRLAEWDGERWTILERTGFNEVTGRMNFGSAIFATGWDKASAILRVFTDGSWSRYRLPKASHTFDHFWQTEWPRIREVEHERFLMDCHGMFYELSPTSYGGKVWGVRPISTHLRVVPDFCAFRGFLVMGGNQVTPTHDSNLLAGEPQAGLWFGKTDDLWQFGKPRGWGGPWWEAPVRSDVPSDPYLMTGFEHKGLHLYHDAPQTVDITIEVDFLGTQNWQTYDTLSIPAGKYVHHEFPTAFSAHWVRFTSNTTCNATAYLMYN